MVSVGNVTNIKTGDLTGFEIQKGTNEDLINMLKNNKNINLNSFTILSNYANQINKKSSEVIKEYKSLSGDALNNFILKVIGHSTTVMTNTKRIENIEQNTLALHQSNTNDVISENDLNDLF